MVVYRKSNFLSTTVEFFSIVGFFGVPFYAQTPGTYLRHTVSMVGLPDTAILGPGWGEVLILSEFYMEISTYSPSKKKYFELHSSSYSSSDLRILNQARARTNLRQNLVTTLFRIDCGGWLAADGVSRMVRQPQIFGRL
jgi:hypothetical protein